MQQIFSFDDNTQAALLVLPKFEVRPYQNKAIATINNTFAKNPNERTICQMATGTGKTVVMAEFIKQNPLKKFTIIAQMEEILEQILNVLIAYGSCTEHEIEIVQQSQPNPEKRIWVCSVQTIARGTRLEKMQPASIIIDECHHGQAESYRKVIDFYRQSTPTLPVLGFTATPTGRTQKIRNALAEVFDSICFQYPIKQGIKDKFLANILYYKVVTKVDLNDIKDTDGDFNQGELAEKVNIHARNKACVEKYTERGAGKAMIFCVNVAHAQHIAQMFKDTKYEAHHVNGDTPDDERKSILEQYKNADIRKNIILSVCGICTEGWDCPNIRMVILARPTKSPIVYLQALGRGTRIVPGIKTDIIVIDIVDHCKRKSLCNCLTTVFSLSQELEMEGNILKQVEEKEQEFTTAGEKPNNEKKTDMETATQENIQLQLANILFDKPIEIENSEITFFSPREGQYFCYISKTDFVAITEKGLQYQVWQNRKWIKDCTQITDAIATCEAIAQQPEYQDTKYVWDKETHQAMKDLPVSDKQKQYLKKYAPQIDPNQISRETASQILAASFSKNNTTPATENQKARLYGYFPRNDVDKMSKRQAQIELWKMSKGG